MAIENATDYVGFGFHLGPGDALRHCTWSALIMADAIIDEMGRRRPRPGPSPEDIVASARPRTLGVLMAHEEIASTTAPDSLMDQHNNQVGISVAGNAFQSHGLSGLTQANIVAACREALEAGTLTMFDPSTGESISTSNWRGFRVAGNSGDPWAHAPAPRPPVGARP